MSKVGQWVFEMQEDAAWMTLGQFTDKHGFSCADVWYEYNFGTEPDVEPDFMEMDDGA